MEYWTGVPAADPATKGPLYRVLLRFVSQSPIGLPSRVVRHNYLEPFVRRLLRTICTPAQVAKYGHCAATWFDTWAARRLPVALDAVVCYENAARDTFKAAKQQGATTILDAASVHYTWQDAFFDPDESSAAHRRITQRKDEEVELADHVITVSEFARESYTQAGVPAEKVTSVPMGADLEVFTRNGCKENPSTEPFIFIFAGHARRLKGIDILLEASEQLAQKRLDHRVQFAGGRDSEFFQDTDAPVDYLGYLKHDQLTCAFHEADCLVLPSRFDSFGRVVVEAMATGLPVLLSEHVGAKEVVTEGETGWVVPAEDVEALADQMQWCIKHPQRVRDMRDAAIKTAQNYSWAAYRERVTNVIASVIGR